MKTKKINITLDFPSPEKVFNKYIYDCLYDYSHPAEVHYGGASSGKSHGVVQKVVLKALQPWKYPRRILWIRKVATTTKDSIFQDVLECLSAFQILKYCKVNMSDYRIELPNGSVFLFKGMDNPEKIKSIKGISDVVMEEATEFTLDDYTQLTLRIRERKHKNKQIFLMFNPVSKVNWVYSYFFVKKQPDAVIYQTTYKSNRFLDDATKSNIEMLANRNEAYYKIYALGEFATLDKLIFPKYERRLLNKQKLTNLPSYFGLDFGYVNDPSAFIHLKVDEENKIIYFIEEYVRKGMLNNEIAETIKILGYQKEVITADSAEKKSIEELRRSGIHRIREAKKGPDSIIQGINFLSQYNFVVDERCVKLIEELENYTWQKDKKTKEYMNKPIDSYNHVLDAARYAVEEINGNSLPKAIVRKKIKGL